MTICAVGRAGGWLLPVFLVSLLLHPEPLAIAADPPVKDAGPLKATGWTFDEACKRLYLSPRDAYLQYVVLQQGLREGRGREAVQAVQGQDQIGNFFGGGRGRRADLFSTFTGAVAIQESLQLDTMRGERPGSQPNVPPPETRMPDRVLVSKLVGPTQPSHPWEKMLAGKKPEVGPLAVCVPEEFFFAEFRSVARLHEVLGAGELWAGHIFTQALGGARSQQTADRLRKQLGLSGLAPEAFDKLGIETIAVTGSDPFLAEGSDITLLVSGQNVGGLATLADGFKGGKAEKGEYLGISYTQRAIVDGGKVYSASPRENLHLRSNSLPAFKRVLETVAGKTPDGKPARRLGESAEFRYVRTRMTRNAEEDGFIYLSDEFIRNLTGPRLKLTERRRVLVYNHLRMISHAALMFRTEFGRAPKSLEELSETKCAPGIFGKDDLAHPDGGTYSLSTDGMSGICSKYGRIDNLTPCLERLVTEVTGPEAEEYNQFVADYSQYWRQFFDPIAVRVTVTPKQYKLETLVLPLIDNSIYTELARGAGKPVPMDLLPTPKREIGGLWMHLPKQALLISMGLEKEPEPGIGENHPQVVNRATVRNNLKQIGIAVHSYAGTNSLLPTTNIRDKAGKPLLSWRVAILPYIEQNNLYQEFKLDEPWDSEHNKKLLKKMPKLFAGNDEKLNAAGKTAYLLPSGKNTLSPAKDQKLTFAGITDATANTVLAVVAHPDQAVPWTKPEDLPFDPKEPLKGLVQPGQDGFDVLMVDGSYRRFANRIAPQKFAALVTPSGGETVALNANEDLTQPVGQAAGLGMGLNQLLRNFQWLMLDGNDLSAAGVDMKKLELFIKDGIGDQIGLHMHDAPRLLDTDISGMFKGEGTTMTGLGLGLRFIFGPSSMSIPVKDAKLVDQFLEELDKAFLAQGRALGHRGIRWRQELDFYRVQITKPHVIRCVVLNLAGLKWRLYWGRIGDGLYFATRPFILEDIAAAHAEGKKPARSEPAHALFRLRPENWKEVIPGYNLSWAEGSRTACHANLEMLANVNRGWNDRQPLAGKPTAELTRRVGQIYGERPFCPDGGAYDLSPDGRTCRCEIHGGHDDPKQLAGPTSTNPTGRLMKTFAGLSAAIRFEDDGLRVIVTVDRKE